MQMSKHVDIRRLWRDIHRAPDGGKVGLLEVFGRDANADVIANFGIYPMADLARHECLFILGRPGAGKSTEAEQIASGLIRRFCDEWIVLIRCKEAGLDLDLEINRDSQWLGGRHQQKPIRLVLDGPGSPGSSRRRKEPNASD